MRETGWVAGEWRGSATKSTLFSLLGCLVAKGKCLFVRDEAT